MIRVALFGGKTECQTVEFDQVPIDSESQFRCVPSGCLGYAAARQIAADLARGAVLGFVAGNRWYRQSGGSTAGEA